MRPWYRTRSKIMPCSHIMKNCWYVVRRCAPVDQNLSAYASCCRRSAVPCRMISRGSYSVTGKHRRRCDNGCYPPRMWRHACGFPRIQRRISRNGRNIPRRNMRPCLRLEESSGAPANGCVSISRLRGCQSGCPTRPMTLLRSLTRRRQMRLRQASNRCCLLHPLLPSPIEGITIVSTMYVCCATPTPSGYVWCLRPRTSHSSSAWTGNKVCLIDPSNRCNCAGYEVPLQRRSNEDGRLLAEEDHSVHVTVT